MAEFFQRLRGRLKYGLLAQEVVDKIAVLGLHIKPYMLVDESPGVTSEIRDDAVAYRVAALSAPDMEILATMPGRERDLQALLKRLDTDTCLGIWVDGMLAGYTWSRNTIIARSPRIPLHQMAADEAYLYDMYVDKRFRGMALAPVLRQHLYHYLALHGVQHFYSITSFFNSSSRRFKAKLGARELEFRLGLKLWSLVEADFRIRRFAADERLQPKVLYLVRR